MGEINLFDDIIEIRKALEQNKLVIFVGAGVSANSKLPNWSELVKKFADEINYPDTEEHFTSDQMLNIPQYMYDTNKERYYEIINNSFDIEMKPNPINELILELLPNHLITTNYDKLLENSSEVNVSQYQVVNSDSDLLTKRAEHYIIKMHGDIDDVKNIVLKEDDYLNYSNNRILTETFIKSLLVDHTFLFVGYSLNDYNLKLIMSWIDYLSSKEKVQKNRHKNYILQTKKISEFEKVYWNNKNIKVIEGDNIPEEMIDKYHNEFITHSEGKIIYTFLKLVSDENTDIDLIGMKKVLIERYKLYDHVDYIYVYDFINTSKITKYNYILGTLILYERDLFLKWRELLQESEIAYYWSKTSINFLYDAESGETINIEDYNLYEQEEELLKNLIVFNYNDLNNQIETLDIAYNRKIYYKLLINFYNTDIHEQFKINYTLSNTEQPKWRNIISKYNVYLYEKIFRYGHKLKNEAIRYVEMLSRQEKESYNYMMTLIIDGDDYKQKRDLANYLTKTENAYNNPPTFTTEEYSSLNKIKTKVYEHFNFLKFNGILLDKYTETISLFEYYIKALLCSQKTIKEDPVLDVDYGNTNSLSNYPWELLDINIFIMYGNNKTINEYIKQNEISKIFISDKVNLSDLFINYCNSVEYLLEEKNTELLTKFNNFATLLNHSVFKNDEATKILQRIVKLFNNDEFVSYINNDSERRTNVVIQLINSLIYEEIYIDGNLFFSFLIRIPDQAYKDSLVRKLSWALRHNNAKFIHNDFSSIFSDLFNKASNNQERLTIISNLFPLLSDRDQKKYSKIIIEKVKELDVEILVNMDNKKVFTNQEKSILKRYYHSQLVLIKENKRPGVYAYPDKFQILINKCIHLILLGFFEDSTFLNDFIDDSDYLSFLLEPANFDYSNVNLKNYMWINIIRNPKYRSILIELGKTQIRNGVLNDIKRNDTTSEQLKFFYKYFAREEDF